VLNQLARALELTITRMLTEMSGLELRYWLSKPEFFGDERGDYHAAMIATAIENWAGKSRSDESFVSPLDRMPFRKTPEPTAEDVAAKVHLAMGTLIGQQQAAER